MLNTICWGASLVAVKPSLEFTTPFRFLLYRYVIAAILSIGFIRTYWPSIQHKSQTLWTIVWMEMIGLTITLALLYVGLDKTTALEAGFISTTAPIFITIAGIIFLHERQEKREWQGLGLTFIGTLFLTLEPWLSKATGSTTQLNINPTESLWGNLLIVGQNITTTIYFILAKTHYKGLPKLFIAAVSFWVGLVSFFGLSLMEAEFSLTNLWSSILADWTHPAVWVASIYMAVFGSIIGLTAYIQGQENVEASEASLFWYLQPLVYVPLGVLVLKEVITPWQIVALILVGLGVWWAQKPLKLLRTKKVVL
jgi:drug/metabolite transporter (DMT)-like permease